MNIEFSIYKKKQPAEQLLCARLNFFGADYYIAFGVYRALIVLSLILPRADFKKFS